MPQYESKEETCIASKLIFDGRVVHLYVDDIRLPDGHKAFREYIRHIGAVCVIPVNEKGEVLCVRQYRYPYAAELLEIPAGKLDSREEDHAEAALRELREETGAHCKKLTYLGKYYGSPAILDEAIDMYFAEDLTMGEASLDEDEFLDVVKIPLEELVNEVLAGNIPDGKTQAAVMRVHEMLRRRKEEFYMKKHVLVVGSINVDYVIETDRLPKLGETLTGKNFVINYGGKGANQAAAIAKQGCEVKMLGAVGQDFVGDSALKNLESFGIDCSRVLRTEAPTGAAMITVCGGDNHILLDAGANACVTPSVIAQNRDLFEWADILVMQYEIPVESVLAAAKLARETDTTVILNPAPVKEVDPALYPLVDWIIPNEFEAELITGMLPQDDEQAKAVIAALCAKGCKNAIVTLGKRGSAFGNAQEVSFFGIYPVKTKDTTAAGDSFIGGLCAKLCEKKPIVDAVAYAAAVSAITVSRPGAACSIPTADEVEAFLRNR